MLPDSQIVPIGPVPPSAQLPAPTPVKAKLSWWSGTKGMLIWSAMLMICFSVPVYRLVQFAWGDELYSYILLIPFVSLYLARMNVRPLVPVLECNPWRALGWFIAGTILLAGQLIATHRGWQPAQEDYLAVMMAALLAFLVGGAFLFLGATTVRRLAFPICFLIFIVPFPSVVRECIESLLQHRSADVAQGMLSLAGMPVLRQDTLFQLPGFVLQVAPECSGVHSTVVLFITSLVAGYLFLKNPWYRALLTVTVIPLALFRNGLRIFTVSELCVNVGHRMIDSYIHRRGGPIFFGLSLIPFLILLLFLRSTESRNRRASIDPKPGTEQGV